MDDTHPLLASPLCSVGAGHRDGSSDLGDFSPASGHGPADVHDGGAGAGAGGDAWRPTSGAGAGWNMRGGDRQRGGDWPFPPVPPRPRSAGPRQWFGEREQAAPPWRCSPPPLPMPGVPGVPVAAALGGWPSAPSTATAPGTATAPLRGRYGQRTDPTDLGGSSSSSVPLPGASLGAPVTAAPLGAAPPVAEGLAWHRAASTALSYGEQEEEISRFLTGGFGVYGASTRGFEPSGQPAWWGGACGGDGDWAPGGLQPGTLRGGSATGGGGAAAAAADAAGAARVESPRRAAGRAAAGLCRGGRCQPGASRRLPRKSPPRVGSRRCRLRWRRSGCEGRGEARRQAAHAAAVPAAEAAVAAAEPASGGRRGGVLDLGSRGRRGGRGRLGAGGAAGAAGAGRLSRWPPGATWRVGLAGGGSGGGGVDWGPTARRIGGGVAVVRAGRGRLRSGARGAAVGRGRGAGARGLPKRRRRLGLRVRGSRSQGLPGRQQHPRLAGHLAGRRGRGRRCLPQ
mmetsp:Transcript_99148/g.318116  ORF Transcript_99148/g.318116 Transcript_99148/m.318116 type:complete len:511 (-) Transcript_99148:518-2050(-)